MKRMFIQTEEFSDVYDKLEAQYKILSTDYEDFEKGVSLWEVNFLKALKEV